MIDQGGTQTHTHTSGSRFPDERQANARRAAKKKKRYDCDPLSPFFILHRDGQESRKCADDI